jgi:hypothetical protein
MVKKENKYSTYLLAIVAIVAVVGVVLMVNNGGTTSVSEGDLVVGEEGDLAGEARGVIKNVQQIQPKQISENALEYYKMQECKEQESDCGFATKEELILLDEKIKHLKTDFNCQTFASSTFATAGALDGLIISDEFIDKTPQEFCEAQGYSISVNAVRFLRNILDQNDIESVMTTFHPLSNNEKLNPSEEFYDFEVSSSNVYEDIKVLVSCCKWS